jgi:hypothetical protein
MAAKTKKLITSRDQIPDFKNPVDLADFWETHELADELFDTGPQVDADFYKRLGIKRPTYRKPKRLSKTG